jgi:hypothetical protein
MSVIDELYENRNETELSFELDEKFERLREFKTFLKLEAPEHLQTHFAALSNIWLSMAELFE